MSLLVCVRLGIATWRLRLKPLVPDVELGRHGCGVRAVVFSPDGRLLASADDNYDHATVKVWNLASREECPLPTPKLGAVLALAFTEEGNTVVSVSRDGAVWQWSADARSAPLFSLGEPVSVAAFNGDGRLLAAVTRVEPLPLPAWLGVLGRVYRFLFMTSRWRRITVWEVRTGKPLAFIELAGHYAVRVALSADGRSLAAVCNPIRKLPIGQGQLIVWEVSPETMHERFINPNASCAGPPAFAPDGRTVVAMVEIRSMQKHPITGRVWDVGSGREVLAFGGPPGRPWLVAISSNAQTLATGQKNIVVLRNGLTGELLTFPVEFRGRILAIAFSPDGASLGVGDEKGAVSVIDVEAARQAIWRG